MLTLHSLDMAEAVKLVPEEFPACGFTPERWFKFCKRRGFRVYYAADGLAPNAFAFVESRPRLVHVQVWDGTTAGCRLLLDHLLKMAGERSLCIWCHATKEDLLTLLLAAGFRPLYEDELSGQPFILFGRGMR
jgi:hypothetical protein